MVKKILFLFTFMFITFSFNLNVKAYTMSKPTSVACLDTGTCFTRENTNLSSYQDRNIYFSPYRMGGVSSQEYVKNLDFTFSNANLCSNQDLSISGVLASIYGFFTEQNYTIHVYSGNNELTCSYSPADPYHSINFTCYGKGGGTLQITVQQNSYSVVKQYELGVSQEMNVSCDISNEAIVNQSITNTQNIINNNNSNTNQIIQDNQQNTQDIIDNQNQNTNSINENITDVFGNICNYNYFNKDNLENGYYTANGVKLVDNGLNKITKDFIEMPPNTSISYSANKKIYSLTIYEFDANQNWIRRTPLTQSNSSSVLNLTTTSNTKYIKLGFNYNQSSVITQDIVDSLEIELVLGSSRVPYSPTLNMCYNKLDDQTNAINGLNDSITSDNPPDTENQISDLENDLISDTPITDLITLPISLLNAYINGFSGSCSPYNLGNLYGTDLILPCLNLEQRLGSNLWTIIDSLFSIFMIYNIAMLMIQAFEGFTSLRDDYEGLYQPKHADVGYQPKHGGDN